MFHMSYCSVLCADAGGSEKQAKKLTKEMRIEIKRAKTELGTDDREPCKSTL